MATRLHFCLKGLPTKRYTTYYSLIPINYKLTKPSKTQHHISPRSTHDVWVSDCYRIRLCQYGNDVCPIIKCLSISRSDASWLDL